jgi:DNA ligase (NAD+)
MNLNEKKALYARAVPAYEDGNPIMSDADFDQLESDIMNEDSTFIRTVGSDRKGETPHLSKMLSLGKIKTWDVDDLTIVIDPKDTSPIQLVLEWFSKFKTFGPVVFIAEPKFDGNAVNLVYDEGDLKSAGRRTSEDSGFDVTSKMSLIAPLHIPTKKRIEMRCEVVLHKDIFDSKYSKDKDPNNEYSNERNYVAGMMTAPTIRPTRMKEMTAVAVELRVHDGSDFKYPDKSHELIDKLGFNKEYPVKRIEFELNVNTDDRFITQLFTQIYAEMLNYRINECSFRLDGFVIKAEDRVRKAMGFNSHDPNWAIAIKFPPKKAITIIKDIEFETGKTGAISPTAVLEPVDLDGSIVRRVSLYNWGYVTANLLYPGAEVELVKSGDIIPRIIKIRKHGNKVMPMPTTCGSCGEPIILTESGIMTCVNPHCPAQAISKIAEGIQVLGVKGIGESTVEALYGAGFTKLNMYFDPNTFNRDWIIATGAFKGRQLEVILDAVKKLKTVKLAQVIRSQCFLNVGDTVSEAIAKHMSGIKQTFSGLNKDAVAKLTTVGSPEYLEVLDMVRALTKAGVEVTAAEPDAIPTAGVIRYEMTGEPPEGTKKDWAAKFDEYNAIATSLTKDTNFLVTDSMSSTSGKMAKARKYGVKIMEYQQFLDYLKAL